MWGGSNHKAGIGFLVVLIAVLGFFEVRWLVREHQYSQIASELVGREVSVHCQRSAASLVDISGFMGYVPYPADGSPADEAFLRNDTCRALGRYVSSDDVRSSPELVELMAVHVLTHEAMHMAGERVEARAECMAVQRNVDTATALGADAAQAALLASAYYELVYPDVPPEYRSELCAPGAEWDEGLPGAPWTAGNVEIPATGS